MARSVQKKFKWSQLAVVPPMIQLASRTVLERPVAVVSVINFILGFLSILFTRERERNDTSNMPLFFKVRFTMTMETAFAARQTAKFTPTRYKESRNVTWPVLITMILTIFQLMSSIPPHTTICPMMDRQTTHPSSMITPKDAPPDGTSHRQWHHHVPMELMRARSAPFLVQLIWR